MDTAIKHPRRPLVRVTLGLLALLELSLLLLWSSSSFSSHTDNGFYLQIWPFTDCRGVGIHPHEGWLGLSLHEDPSTWESAWIDQESCRWDSRALQIKTENHTYYRGLPGPEYHLIIELRMWLLVTLNGIVWAVIYYFKGTSRTQFRGFEVNGSVARPLNTIPLQPTDRKSRP